MCELRRADTRRPANEPTREQTPIHACSQHHDVPAPAKCLPKGPGDTSRRARDRRARSRAGRSRPRSCVRGRDASVREIRSREAPIRRHACRRCPNADGCGALVELSCRRSISRSGNGRNECARAAPRSLGIAGRSFSRIGAERARAEGDPIRRGVDQARETIECLCRSSRSEAIRRSTTAGRPGESPSSRRRSRRPARLARGK